MTWRTVLFFALPFMIFLGACETTTEPEIIPSDPDPEVDISVPEGFEVEVFAEGLELPTSIAFPPDDSERLFVGELQSGKIRIIEDGELLSEPFAEVTTNVTGEFPVEGENGLIGLTFDPDYSANGHVYVTYATRTDTGEVATVARFTEEDNIASDFTELLTDLPSAEGHQIQNLTFGPDDRLYVSVGDAYASEKAQDTTAMHGKILRITRDGDIPEDNPFGEDSYVYALGLRNSYDLIFTDSGELLSTDNGPNGMDEFNVILPGENYGWPEVGNRNDPDYVDPVHTWNEAVSPTGMHIYRGEQFPSDYQGKLFQVLFGQTHSDGPSNIAKRVQVASLEDIGPDGTIEFEDFAVFEFPTISNPLDVTEGPDGSLYVSDIFQGTIYRIRAE